MSAFQAESGLRFHRCPGPRNIRTGIVHIDAVLVGDDAPLPGNVIAGTALLDRVTPTFKAGAIGTLKVLLLL